jgi:DNA-binding CsgD family transcriptional regulator
MMRGPRSHPDHGLVVTAPHGKSAPAPRDAAATALGLGSEQALAALSWHEAVGRMIRALDEDGFWDRLVALLGGYVPVNNWVCLRFKPQEPPAVLAVFEGTDDSLRRFDDYLHRAHRIDPFYRAVIERPATLHRGLVTLDEIAPDQFTRTEYYQCYFKLNVLADEVQYLVPDGPDGDWLSLSLGCASRFKPAQLALLRLISPWVLALMASRAQIERRIEPVPRPAPRPRDPAGSEAARELTGREQEVMHLMLGGHSSKLIARRLGISEETVKVHRRHIYAKYQVGTQSQLFSMFLAQRV